MGVYSRHKITFVAFLFVLFGFCLPLAAQQAGPRLFFSDLESAPNTGGEQNIGAYVTIYGEGFGPSRGNSTVTLGGREVARYVLWGQDNAPRSLDMIVVQPGPNAVTGGIIVTVNGMSSNPLPFTIRPGNIYFVATAGNDSNAGSFAQPWRTIVKAKNTISAGDIAYIRDGVTETREENYSAALSIETGGTRGSPKALVAYPGETATIGSTNLEFGMRVPNNPDTIANDWVIAKLVLRAQIEAVEIGGAGSSRWRVVGNNISCPVGDGQTGCFTAALASNVAFLGNEVHGVSKQGPQPSKQYHAVYFTTDTNRVEVGWNHIHDNNTCRAIQFHSSPLNEDTTGYNQYDLNVHDNLIHGDVCDGIVFATVDPSKGPVRAFNNVIYDVGLGPDPPDGSANYAGIYVAGGTNTGADGRGEVEIYNNTLYNCGARKTLQEPIGDEGAFSRGPGSPGLFMSLKNNIVYAVQGEDYIAPSSDTTLIRGSNNLWFGSGAPPAFLTATVGADPGFASIGSRDFRLQAQSPAIDAGTNTGILRDYNGILRPQGSALDLGAHEYVQQSAPRTTLYFPRLVSTDGSGSGVDSEYTGLAVVNLANTVATLSFSALNQTGALIGGANITNPASVTLGPGQQLARVDFQIFGAGLPAAGPQGWIRMDSTVREIVGFFLVFNGALSILDGADVSATAMTSFILPQIGDPDFTQIHIANPGTSPASLKIELYRSDGALRVSSVSRALNANGALAEHFSSLFPGVAPNRGDYIRVASNTGVVPFELLGRSGRYVMGLRGQDTNGGGGALYCPQYVVGGPLWRSILTVINLESTPGTVTLKFVGEDGAQIGTTRSLSIAGLGKILVEDQVFFGNTSSSQMQGYVLITSSGPRLAGSVVFGDSAPGAFSTALPLVSTLQTDVVFSQLASDSTYFTGLAIVNPDNVPVAATIEVFASEGNRIATTVETIPARGRTSRLLTQYFPGLVGQSRSSGYIRVTAGRGLASFALFGTSSGSVLSAIPPQVVP